MKREKPADTVSADSPKRNRGGAPLGNTNASRDRGFTHRMREAQRTAKRGQRDRRARILREHLALVEGALTPAAELELRELAALAFEVQELDRIVGRTGRTRRDGSPGPLYERALAVRQSYLAALAKFNASRSEVVGGIGSLEAARGAIAAIADAWPAAVLHVVTFGGVERGPGGHPFAPRREVPADAAPVAAPGAPAPAAEQRAASAPGPRVEASSAPQREPAVDEVPLPPRPSATEIERLARMRPPVPDGPPLAGCEDNRRTGGFGRGRR